MRKQIGNGAKCMTAALACIVAQVAQGEIQADKTSSDHPYTSISSRNIFALVDVSGDPILPVPPKVPTNAKLTGIATVAGMKQAFFILNEAPANGKSPAAHSVILCEGQSFAKLEVLQINPEARTVKVKNDGNESVIGLNAGEARK